MPTKPDFSAVQRRLVRAGYEIGAVDGIAGTKTWTGILAYVGQRPMTALGDLGEAAKVYLPKYEITSTVERICNFLGQGAHETQRFRAMREIWGPTPAQLRYEGRADLGNTQPGDGRRYLGRGIFQLTGRANYREVGSKIGKPLEARPELAETPEVAMETAAYYWDSRGLSALADQGLEDKITRRINGGTNGIADRRVLVARAKGLFL